MSTKKGGFSDLFFGSILPKIYAWGATVVIIGAMFKILHLPYAGTLLGLGLSVEAGIFFLSAFEPRHKELEWDRVYPELSDSYSGPKRKVSMGGSSGISQQLDKTLDAAKVTPNLVENLGKGMRGLAESASKLGTMANASVATSEYAQNVQQASRALSQMNKSYANTISSMSEMASASKDAKEYHTQVQNVTKNLSGLNAVYEMELKDANTHLKSMNKFYGNVSQAMESIAQAGRNSDKFRDQLARLTENLGSLNQVYGNMLTAMRGNMSSS